MNASLKAIAKRANVAEATVSRILRQRDTCSPETRERVLQVARDLKYRPNMLVQGMQTGKTLSVGVMLPHVREPYNRAYEALHDELAARGYCPFLLCTGGDRSASPDLPTSELVQVHRLIDRRVDGVVIAPAAFALYDKSLREVWERNLPMIMIFGELDVPQAQFVGVDEHRGGELAAEHLLSLGHRRIAVVESEARLLRERINGFVAACDAAGVSPKRVLSEDEYRCRGHAASLVHEADPPTAVFCESDFLAESFCDAAMVRGFKIPADVAVVGFGDLPVTRIRRPQITSVSPPNPEVGRRAATLLLDAIDGRLVGRKPKRESIRLEPRVVPRASTVGGPA